MVSVSDELCCAVYTTSYESAFGIADISMATLLNVVDPADKVGAATNDKFSKNFKQTFRAEFKPKIRSLLTSGHLFFSVSAS